MAAPQATRESARAGWMFPWTERAGLCQLCVRPAEPFLPFLHPRDKNGPGEIKSAFSPHYPVASQWGDGSTECREDCEWPSGAICPGGTTPSAVCLCALPYPTPCPHQPETDHPTGEMIWLPFPLESPWVSVVRVSE